MKDLTVCLEHRPGALADLGEALGRAGVSIEGGGAWVVDGRAVGHFLFVDEAAARKALEAAGIEVVGEREVLLQRLDQGKPGQLGAIARQMGDANVNIEVMYSDHDHQLVLGVADPPTGRRVSEQWEAARQGSRPGTREHVYEPAVRWTGNAGAGTPAAGAYARSHEIEVAGKPSIAGSSDPAFRGDRARWNPEELLVSSLSACHMLWYLHLCADAGVNVVAYEDRARGVMVENADGSGTFTRVVLRPHATITPSSDRDVAVAVHERAHRRCFIASSVRFPVVVEPTLAVREE
jgi:organic hydroperoxide reductase OsmC/OhrA